VSSFFLDRTGGEEPEEDDWVLTLFIAGRSPNSQRALQNLREIIAQHLPGRCSVQVVDILDDPLVAIARDILVAPTLVRLSPLPEVKITGSLSDRQKVLVALGLVEAER